MKIKSGDLNQSIAIFSFNNNIDDGAGGSQPSRVLYWSTSAMVRQLSSYELTQLGITDLRDVFEFTVRYRTDKTILNNMILNYRGMDMEIYSAKLDYVSKEYVMIKAVWNNRPLGGE